ncbi:putative receptor-like protein kinase At3g47110 [Lolium rigidum]|uniref:putative receptor-like protein kinase At3g47110 n=1 Tax=Lolium rigidum TaxID=89674 RepID=UPI001F5D6B7C|nr:putative receptor-like protein kinase At3g47110 [Lolium rigidum]
MGFVDVDLDVVRCAHSGSIADLLIQDPFYKMRCVVGYVFSLCSGGHLQGFMIIIGGSQMGVSITKGVMTDEYEFDSEFEPLLSSLGPIPLKTLRSSVSTGQVGVNMMYGSIRDDIGSKFSKMKVLGLGNQLSGKIPDSIQNYIVLGWLLLDNNSFEGRIPQSLKNIKGLSKLNLTMNKFSGNIPDSLGSIENLQELYLAHNELSGSIPSVLQNLTSLSKLDVSFNNLQGEVPHGVVFRNMTYTAVDGNINLRGGAPQLHLASCPTNPLSKDKKRMQKSLLVSIAAIGAIFLSLSVIILVWIFHKKLKKCQKTIVQYLVGEDHYKRIPYHALLRGTNGFSNDNFLGRGSYGVVYKCVLDNEERTLAVKVFNLGESKCFKSFEAEYMSALVGDFGISRIIQENTSETMHISYSSTGIRGSIGYVAPEYGEGSVVSPPGDIYCLGILLLELFTGRSPTDGTFSDSLGLHKFSEDALPDRTLEIADPTIWLHGEPHDNVLGISCSKQQPRDRTLTRDAAAEMNAIRDAYIAFVASS